MLFYDKADQIPAAAGEQPRDLPQTAGKPFL
jgi:hypothetical protein